MVEERYLDKQRVMRVSAVIEDAPYVVEGTGKFYTDLYSMKCKSSQSQNCPRTSMPKVSRLEGMTLR